MESALSSAFAPLRRALLAAALASAACAHQSAAPGSRGGGCGQDVVRRSAVLQRHAEEALAPVRAYKGPRPSRRAEDAQPIRFAAFYEDLTVPGHFCRNVGESIDGISRKPVTCGAEDVLNSSRIEHLKTTLMPEAMRQLSLLLKVNRVPGNRVVPKCSDFTVPDAHKTAGVPNADFVVYVSAAPADAAAWAGGCAYHPSSGQPFAGYINFSPDTLDPRAGRSIDKSVGLPVHELMHALGFSGGNFGSHKLAKIPTKKVERRGKTVTVLAGPATIREARAWSGCADDEGVEVEDEGGRGTAGSHLERRVYRDDVIGGIVGGPPSRITLAVFEDLGWYTPNYAALKMEPAFLPEAAFGKNLGCGFLRSKCTTTEGGMDTVFCSSLMSRGCSWDLKGSGMCRPGAWMDGCATVQTFSNGWCTTDDGSDYTAMLQSMGQTFGESSRCVMASGFAKQRPGYLPPSASMTPVCLTAKCIAGVLHMEIGEKTFACPPAGGKVTGFEEVGFTGSVECPASAHACAMIDPVGLSPATATPKAATSTPSVKGDTTPAVSHASDAAEATATDGVSSITSAGNDTAPRLGALTLDSSGPQVPEHLLALTMVTVIALLLTVG